MTKPNKGSISNWGIIFHSPHGYCICGEIQGGFIRTSPIITLSKGFVETQNSIYSLIGDPTWKKHKNAEKMYNLRMGF